MVPDEKVVNAIEVAGAALERHERFYLQKQAEAEQVAAKIPGVVEVLLQTGRIEPHEAKEAAEALKDPVKALELCKRAATHVTAEEEARLGQPVASHTKKASNGATAGGNYLGRRSAEPPESWQTFKRDLGL